MPTFECDGCGACCRTWRIFVSEQDAAVEPRIARESRELPPEQQTVLWRFQLFPLPFHESCCFLDKGDRCTIYETRPRVCREFEAGGDRCQEARAQAGLPRLEPKNGEVQSSEFRVRSSEPAVHRL